MSVIIHGIRNCDTMKKAFGWLDSHGIDYRFHDYKKAGVEDAQLERWCGRAGWETVLNRSGTTFRKLPEAQKEGLDRKKAISLMLAQPSMIKRPILEVNGELEIGFAPERYARLFGR